MGSILSCVTLSAEPALRTDLPDNVTYLNHVSIFSDSEGLHAQRLASLEAISTPNWVWCDVDDPWRWPALNEATSLVLHGDETVVENYGSIVNMVKGVDWNAEKHLSSPRLLHKAICPTAATHALLDILPRGNYWTEHMLYWLLAAHCGSVYLPKVVTEWNCNKHGMNTKVGAAMRNSTLWLMKNRQSVLEQLRSI